ncbi:MAG TPA: TIGR03435 family protein [Vicinamibacterales bacterium]
MSWRRVLWTLLLVPAVVSAQTTPTFEVASVRPSADQVSQASVGVHIDGSQVRIVGLPLKLYVGMAYGLKPQQIAGPDWLGQPRFDLAAKIPDGASLLQLPQMFQALLADRFQMKSHRETKEFSVFALTVTKDGFKLQPSPSTPEAPSDKPPAVTVTAGGNASGSGADLGRGSSFSLANNRVEIHKMTMLQIAELLTRLSDRPVIDATGIAGAYDLSLEMTPEDFMGVQIRGGLNNGAIIPAQALRLLDNAALDPFTNALQKSGLSLESRKAPLEVLVIDSIQKAPTEN